MERSLPPATVSSAAFHSDFSGYDGKSFFLLDLATPPTINGEVGTVAAAPTCDVCLSVLLQLQPICQAAVD